MRRMGKVPPGILDVPMSQRRRNRFSKAQGRMRVPLPQTKGALIRKGEPPGQNCEVAREVNHVEEVEYFDLFAQREHDVFGWKGFGGFHQNSWDE
jgi:hypothetical protein